MPFYSLFGGGTSESADITAFAMKGVQATIINTDIIITLPCDTSTAELSVMPASFTITGARLEVNGIVQVNGVTTNDFTKPVSYTVYSNKGGTNIYTVNATIAINNAKAITMFSVKDKNDNVVAADISGTSINLVLPFGNSRSDLVATFNTTGRGVTIGSVGQVSGITHNDFSSPKIYTVADCHGSTQDYTVTISEAPSNANAITAFSINGNDAIIDGTNIILTVPCSTDLTNRAAIFTTNGQEVTVDGKVQESGITTNNFTSQRTYIVRAADNTLAYYTVTVNPSADGNHNFASFSINGVIASIDNGNHTINLELPCGTERTALVASFAAEGRRVFVGTMVQTSGLSENNFTDQVVYTVETCAGTLENYTVNVTTGGGSSSEITQFSINGHSGTFNGNEISVILPFDTISFYQKAIFSINGHSVTVSGAGQESGVTYNDFTLPVTYTVHACNLISKQDYIVSVSIAAPATTKDLLSFSISSANGTFTANGDINNIDLTLPKGSSLINRRAAFTTNGNHVMVNGVVQTNGVTYNDFSNPVTYTVHAEDGSTKEYIVNVCSFTVKVTTYNASNVIINRKVYIYKDAPAYLETLQQIETNNQAPYIDEDITVFKHDSYKYSEGAGSNGTWLDGDDINPRSIVKYPVDSTHARFVTYNDFNRSSITGYILLETDSSGRIVKATSYMGPGADGAWFTSDDDIKPAGVAINQATWSDANNAHTHCLAADGTTIDHQWDLNINTGSHTVTYTKYDSLDNFLMCFIYDYSNSITHWTRYYSDVSETTLTKYIKQTMNSFNEWTLSEQYTDWGTDSTWYTFDDIRGSIDGYPYTIKEHDGNGYQTSHYSYSDAGFTLEERGVYTTE